MASVAAAPEAAATRKPQGEPPARPQITHAAGREQPDDSADERAGSPTGVAELPVNQTTDHHLCSKTQRQRRGFTMRKKGVSYRRDGAIKSCRFCEILAKRDEDFLFEDDCVAVFRPLRPVVPSHILIVPRAHIRNIKMLTSDHRQLLERMKHVAELVVGGKKASPRATDPAASSSVHRQSSAESCGSSEASPTTASSVRTKYSFHVPPFNSIDHVHMHAFQENPEDAMGYVGRIKYRTESWWCRSFDNIMTLLAKQPKQQRQRRLSQPTDRHRYKKHATTQSVLEMEEEEHDCPTLASSRHGSFT